MKLKKMQILPVLLALALCLGLLPGMALAEEPADTRVRVDFLPNGGTITSIRGIGLDELLDRGLSLPGDILFVDVNSGVAGMSTDEEGKIADFPVAERAGYTFAGWYMVSGPDANAAYDGTLTDFSGAKLVSDITAFGEDVSLAARWSEAETKTHTVDFDINGGTGEVPPSLEVPDGKTVPLPKADNFFAPDGYTFAGWYYFKDSKTAELWEADKTVEKDLVLYAGWRGKDGKVVVIQQTPAAKPGGSGATEAPETPKTPETPAAPGFTDVAASSPFAAAISWAVERNITNGTGDGTTFSPAATCSQGQILTFLWRSQGSPEPAITNPFTSSIPAAFQKAAVWAYEKGLVSGSAFDAAAPCTRGSSVTYMWLLAGSPEAPAAVFSDVPASGSYAGAVSWAVEQGITNGTGDGSAFSPNATCTRGQIVTFLYRAYAEKT